MRPRVLQGRPDGRAVLVPRYRGLRFAVGVAVQRGRFVPGHGGVHRVLGDPGWLLVGVVVAWKQGITDRLQLRWFVQVVAVFARL